MLYDRRSDKMIVGKTLWSPDDLNRVRTTVPQPYTSTEVFTENSIEDKTNALKIETSQKLSFLSGLINVEGSAKYLKDTKTSKQQSRVVLIYETTTELQKLKVENLGTGNIEYPEVFDQDIATDVGVGILYGAKAFFVFDKEISKDESLKDVDRNMEVFIKSVSGISVDGSVNVREEQKENIYIHCKGTFIIRFLRCVPKEFLKFLDFFKSLILTLNLPLTAIFNPNLNSRPHPNPNPRVKI